VDAKRLEAIKSNLSYSLPMGLETAKDVGGTLAWYAGIYGTPDAVATHYQNISKVTPTQLVDFAKEYMAAHNLTVLSLTPKAAAAGGKK
jgi:zinc protease